MPVVFWYGVGLLINLNENFRYITERILTAYNYTTTVLRLSGFFRDNLGEPVPQETFTRSHLSIMVINHPLSASSIYYNPFTAYLKIINLIWLHLCKWS